MGQSVVFLSHVHVKSLWKFESQTFAKCQLLIFIMSINLYCSLSSLKMIFDVAVVVGRWVIRSNIYV